MLFKEAIIITLGLLPIIILYKNHPSTPPSMTSSVPKMPFIKACKILCSKHDYKYLTYLTMIAAASTVSCAVNLDSYL